MKKLLKWIGIVLGILLVGVAITVFVLVNTFNNRMEKIWDVEVENLTIPSDSASIAAGQHFIPYCQSCHGEALEGKVFFEDPKIGKIYSPNLTKGEGGIGGTYTDKDWIRALRHGINPKGLSLMVMPSKDIHHMSEKDLVNLIAYLKTIPAVDNSKGANVLPMFTKILMQLGAFGVIYSSEVIDHKAAFSPEVKQGETKEYGEYIVNIIECRTCHGTDFAGGKSPDPNSPIVPNITPKGNIGKWKDVDFVSTMRTGITPENKTLNDTFMPWKHVGQMPESDLKAMYLYLKSLPPKDTP